MKLEEILSLQEFQFPANRPSEQSFISFFEERTAKYINLLEESTNLFDGIEEIEIPHKEYIDSVKFYTKEIGNILRLVHEGTPGKAWDIFKGFISSIQPMLFKLTPHNNKIEPNHFFRAKNTDATCPIKPKEYFFHAPFELSSKVGSTRFSPNGFPCMYLANCLIVNYLELRSMNLDTFQVAKLETRIPLNLVNLDYTSPSVELKQTNSKVFQSIIQQKGLLFPLHLSCFTMYNEEDKKVGEYIIPQFFLEWLRDTSSQFDGIQYPSTRINSDKFKRHFYNVVLPPKNIKKEGFCDYLKGVLFNMSEVCSWRHYKEEIQEFFYKNFSSTNGINVNVSHVEWPLGGDSTQYENTELGQMEFYLVRRVKAEKIDF